MISGLSQAICNPTRPLDTFFEHAGINQRVLRVYASAGMTWPVRVRDLPVAFRARDYFAVSAIERRVGHSRVHLLHGCFELFDPLRQRLQLLAFLEAQFAGLLACGLRRLGLRTFGTWAVPGSAAPAAAGRDSRRSLPRTP